MGKRELMIKSPVGIPLL